MKRRRSRHNPIPPPWYVPSPAVLAESYQRQVERSTEKLEREYLRAEKRAEQAERRLERAKAQPTNSRKKKQLLAQLQAEWEIRMAELEEYRRLMMHPTAGAPKVMHRVGREERLEMGIGRSRRPT